MKEKIDKALEITTIIVFVYICIAGILFLISFKEMLNDHRCYNLPLNEFYQDKKCEKYWDMKNWSDEIEKNMLHGDNLETPKGILEDFQNAK